MNGSDDRLAIASARKMLVWQILRFLVVGVVLNLSLYAAYLVLSARIGNTKVAMSVTFSVGAVLGFLANKAITFRHRGKSLAALVKYGAFYGILYSVNLISLIVFADLLRLPHQLVQGMMILILPVIAFFVQRFWVFSAASN